MACHVQTQVSTIRMYHGLSIVNQTVLVSRMLLSDHTITVNLRLPRAVLEIELTLCLDSLLHIRSTQVQSSG